MDNIALINSPDEFSKLCKCLFAAEFDDFQTIDDSGGDKGNDGYSEHKKRLFQIYCPRKPLKADDLRYKSKIKKDLNKAKKLVDSGKYTIQEWIFVTPAELRENVQTYIREEAEKKGFVGMAWASPKLMELLAKYPYLQNQFPDLILPNIAQKMDLLYATISESTKCTKGRRCTPRENFDNEISKDIRNSSAMKFEFSTDQKFLIKKVNDVHTLNGQSGYDFENDLGSALHHIQYKSSVDWYITASVFISNAIPHGGIRNIFKHLKEPLDPYKKSILDNYKKNLQISYDKLQKLRRANKRGGLQQDFLAPYEREVLKITEIPVDRLGPLFEQFESDLLAVFRGYKFKDN